MTWADVQRCQRRAKPRLRVCIGGERCQRLTDRAQRIQQGDAELEASDLGIARESTLVVAGQQAERGEARATPVGPVVR